MSPDAARMIGAGIAALALYGVGMSMGSMFSNWINSVARNPEAKDHLNLMGFLGFAATESIGLYALVIAIMILKA